MRRKIFTIRKCVHWLQSLWRNSGDADRLPSHLVLGASGERCARRFLESQGLVFLVRNFRSPRGEVDLIFRTRCGDRLVFVEVKTRSDVDPDRNPTHWVRWKQRGRMVRAALDYLRKLGNPAVFIQFDMIEVHADGQSDWPVRHVPGAFQLPDGVHYLPSQKPDCRKATTPRRKNRHARTS